MARSRLNVLVWSSLRIALALGAVSFIAIMAWFRAHPGGGWFESIGAMIIAGPIMVIVILVTFCGLFLVRWMLMRGDGDDEVEELEEDDGKSISLGIANVDRKNERER